MKGAFPLFSVLPRANDLLADMCYDGKWFRDRAHGARHTPVHPAAPYKQP